MPDTTPINIQITGRTEYIMHRLPSSSRNWHINAFPLHLLCSAFFFISGLSKRYCFIVSISLGVTGIGPQHWPQFVQFLCGGIFKSLFTVMPSSQFGFFYFSSDVVSSVDTLLSKKISSSGFLKYPDMIIASSKVTGTFPFSFL
jgi:hypothetical protein